MTFQEFIQLCLDFLYLLLFLIVSALAFWRALQAIKRLCEHPKHRLLRLVRDTGEDVALYSEASEAYRAAASGVLTVLVKEQCAERAEFARYRAQRINEALTVIRGDLRFFQMRLHQDYMRVEGAAGKSGQVDVVEDVQRLVQAMKDFVTFKDGASDAMLIQHALCQIAAGQGEISEGDLGVINQVLA